MNIPFFDMGREIDFVKDESIVKFIEKGVFVNGSQVLQFEKLFATYLSVSYCISCGNGTDALELALEVSGVGEGDEVIIPAFGWVSVFTAVKRKGAIPVFVDVEDRTGNIDLQALQEAISPKTKAVIPIHLYGNPGDILSIKEICHKHNLILIEDCAQAHGAKVGGRAVGTFGDLAIFSFYPTKNLGALGDGGAVVTNTKEMAEKLRALGDYGRASRHEFAEVGRNSRLDELQAYFLNKKLPFLEEKNRNRQQIAQHYLNVIKSSKQVDFENSVFYQFPILVSKRDRFVRHMSEAGIGVDIHYPFTIPGAFSQSEENVPNAKWFSEHVVSIPIYPGLTEAEISYICDHLKRLEHFIL